MSTRCLTRSSRQSGSEDTRSAARQGRARGRGKRGRGGSTSSAPPEKRSRNNHPPETGNGKESLTRDEIPTIVQAVLSALPTGESRATDPTAEPRNPPAPQEATITNESSSRDNPQQELSE